MKTIIKRESARIFGVITMVALVLSGTLAVANAQTTTTATTSVTTEMSPGDAGAQVSALQTFLATDPSVYPQGLVTGYYGSLTTAAVQAYQCKNGIVCQGDPTTTGYGNVGPATLAEIETQEGINPGAGVSVQPTSNPSTVSAQDLSVQSTMAPILSAPLVATSSTSATITWMTSEPATNLVMYGTMWPFLYASAPQAMSTNGFSETANVSITGLQPNTTYYYVLQSVDANGNLQWSIGHSFSTSE